MITACLPGAVSALAIATLLKLGMLQPLENFAYRTLFQLRGATPWDDRVVVVAIDDASLKALGRFPWPRQKYTDLLRVLTRGKASTVVLDILLTEPSAADAEMAIAMVEHGRVVLPKAWDYNGEVLQPTPVLRESALAEGHIYQQQDADGIARRIIPQLKNTPMLAISAAQVYSLVREPVALPDLQRPLWINWAGSVAQIPTYSFSEVVQGRIPSTSFNHKIVVVGMTAIGFDALQTPFDHNPPTTNVYLHATVLHNILQKNFLWVPAEPWVMVSLGVGGIVMSGIMARWSRRRLLLGLLVVCLGWAVLCVMLLWANVLMPLAAPVALWTSTTVLLTFQQRLREESAFQREVERLWRTYRQGLVVQPTPVASTATTQPEGGFVLSSAAQRMTQLSMLAEQFGRSQSTQTAIARSLSIGLLAADLEGWVWFCNPIAAECLSLQVGDRLQYHLIPEWLTPEQWQMGVDALQQQMPQVPYEIERDGRWFELRLEPLIGEQQRKPQDSLGELEQVEGLLLLLEDITTRKQVEENLNQQMQEMQRINQLKDDFLNTVSHEMRAPLSNMKMAIRMLQLAETPEQKQRYFQILESECIRETNLIEDLLSFQQLEAGAKELVLEEIDLSTWLPQLLAPFQQRIQERQLSLQLEIPQRSTKLVCDRSSLERILVELVNNACKYTPPEGTITVAAEIVNRWMQIAVTNSGVEIPAAEHPKVFDKFYRVASGDRWQQGGTGLGLALVKKLVEQLGGNIDLTSQFEQTTFTVQMPIRRKTEP